MRDTHMFQKLKRSRFWLSIIGVVILCGLAYVGIKQSASLEGSVASIPTFEVREGPLLISIVESGTIAAREQRIIKSEVEGDRQIIWLIPEGTTVNMGDLLARMDSGRLEDQLLNQEIEVQSAETNYIDARESLAIRKLNGESQVSRAELRAQFAAEDLTKYIEGDYPLDLKSAQSEITLTLAELSSAEHDLESRKKLFEKEYVSERELDSAQRLFQRRKVDLELAESNLELLKGFTYERELARLTSDKEEADREFERAKLEAASGILQSEGDVKSKQAQLQHKEKKLRKLEEQILNCEIVAPTEGMVVYARASKHGKGEPVKEGAWVRERQELIYLPTAKAVMARVAIHESNLAKIRPGLGVKVTVDALPGREFTGRVATIARLPDARSMYLNPDLKVYDTEIYIDGEGGELRSGMSCTARIMVERHDTTVYVPVQSVVLTTEGPVVHVLNGNRLEERPVEVGLDNNRMIRITSNLKAGERVSLVPPEPSAVENNDAFSETFIKPGSPPEVDHKVVEVLDSAAMKGAKSLGDKRKKK